MSGYVSESTALELTKVFGHLTSTILAIPPATATNSGTEEKWLLRESGVTKQSISVAASLVGGKHRNIQWKDLNSISSSSYF